MRLHIFIGRSKVFDLFPRTYKGKNRCVLWKKHALINSRERPLKSDINLEQSSHVETVVQLVNIGAKPDYTVRLEVDVDEFYKTVGEEKRHFVKPDQNNKKDK